MAKEWTQEERMAASDAARERAAQRRLTQDEADYTPPAIMPGEAPVPVSEDDEPNATVSEPLDDFGRFLQTLDAETRDLLGEDDLRDIYAEQQKKAREEKRAGLKKAVAARAKHHALVGEGLLPQSAVDDQIWRDRMNEQIRHTIDLPEMGDIGIRVDQRVYLHGHTYVMTRAEYESIVSIEYQAQQAELLFEGKDKRHWLRRRARGSLDGLRDDDGAVRIQ